MTVSSSGSPVRAAARYERVACHDGSSASGPAPACSMPRSALFSAAPKVRSIALALPFPLPTPGSPDRLRAYVEELGVVTEYKGSEQRSGVDADHVAAGLDIVKLARSSRLATIFGIGPDQAQGVSEMAKQVAFSAELWFDRESGRLVGLLLNGQTLQGQITKGSLVVNLSEPADADPFAAPTTFTDVPLKELIGNSLNNEGGGSAEATPAPDVPKPPPPQ